MRSRITIAHAARCRPTSFGPLSQGQAVSPLVSLLAGHFMQQSPTASQSRSASILANLRDNKSAYSKRIRKGRGPSSGYGKTSGRGHKGQGQHGKVKPWFQGGQTPLIFKHGRMGFVNYRKDEMAEVNVDRLQAWIDAGRIDPKKPITPKEILKAGLIGSIKDGIKLLARNAGSLRTPIDIIVSRASASAIEAVERAGGKIVTRYYTKDSLRRLFRDQSVNTTAPLPVGPEHVTAVLEQARNSPFMYRLPDPTSRWDIEYYRDPAHRGYLSHPLKPGESPSLFFKVPATGDEVRKKSEKVKAKKAEKHTNKGEMKLF